jgi:hypothetical protein
MHDVRAVLADVFYVCVCVWHGTAQVLQLRADLATLQATNSQANAIASAEVDTALNSVRHTEIIKVHTFTQNHTHCHTHTQVHYPRPTTTRFVFACNVYLNVCVCAYNHPHSFT